PVGRTGRLRKQLDRLVVAECLGGKPGGPGHLTYLHSDDDSPPNLLADWKVWEVQREPRMPGLSGGIKRRRRGGETYLRSTGLIELGLGVLFVHDLAAYPREPDSSMGVAELGLVVL